MQYLKRHFVLFPITRQLDATRSLKTGSGAHQVGSEPASSRLPRRDRRRAMPHTMRLPKEDSAVLLMLCDCLSRIHFHTNYVWQPHTMPAGICQEGVWVLLHTIATGRMRQFIALHCVTATHIHSLPRSRQTPMLPTASTPTRTHHSQATAAPSAASATGCATPRSAPPAPVGVTRRTHSRARTATCLALTRKKASTCGRLQQPPAPQSRATPRARRRCGRSRC